MKFIEKCARVDDDNNIFSDENVDNEVSDRLANFIADLHVEQSICNYLPIQNIIKPKEVAMQEDINFGVFHEKSDLKKYLPECFNEQKIEYDEFKNFDERIEIFKNNLHIYVKIQPIHFTLQICIEQDSS